MILNELIAKKNKIFNDNDNDNYCNKSNLTFFYKY